MNKVMIPLALLTIMALEASVPYIPLDYSSPNSYKAIKHRSQNKRRQRARRA